MATQHFEKFNAIANFYKFGSSGFLRALYMNLELKFKNSK